MSDNPFNIKPATNSRHWYLLGSAHPPMMQPITYVLAFTDREDRDVVFYHSQYFGLVDVESLTQAQALTELRFGKIGIGCYRGSKDYGKDLNRRTDAMIELRKFDGRFPSLSRLVEYVPVRLS